jgi:GNAT superfamily N-acetyltransferase
MTTGQLSLYEPGLLQKSTTRPCRRGFETTGGPLTLQSFCSPALVASLKAESGLHAFAHFPEREHQLLQGIAERPDCALTLAYTPAGEIVGQVTIAPTDEWWQGVTNTYEIAIEVSTHWRGLGIARQLLSLALEFDAVEKMILVALGLSWHWDFKEAGLSPFGYRSLLQRVFEPFGFFECKMDEPNIKMDPANILLMRLGKRVETAAINQVLQRMRF